MQCTARLRTEGFQCASSVVVQSSCCEGISGGLRQQGSQRQLLRLLLHQEVWSARSRQQHVRLSPLLLLAPRVAHSCHSAWCLIKDDTGTTYASIHPSMLLGLLTPGLQAITSL